MILCYGPHSISFSTQSSDLRIYSHCHVCVQSLAPRSCRGFQAIKWCISIPSRVDNSVADNYPCSKQYCDEHSYSCLLVDLCGSGTYAQKQHCCVAGYTITNLKAPFYVPTSSSLSDISVSLTRSCLESREVLSAYSDILC